MSDIDTAIARFEAELKAEAELYRIEADKYGTTAPREAGNAEGRQWAITEATYKSLKELAALRSFMEEDSHQYREYKRYELLKKMEGICGGKHSSDYLEGFFNGALEVYEQARPRVRPRVEQYRPI